MLKVNSYCIFNNYCGVLPILICSHFAIFPKGWQIRIHHDETLDNSQFFNMVDRLRRNGFIKTVFVNEPPIRCKAMLWRMIPIWDPEVEFVFCKDADSVPTPRERMIMEGFVNSNFSVLGINDNPAHTLPLMGGMIGFNTKKFIQESNIRTFGEFISLQSVSDESWRNHGRDQSYLNDCVYPKIKRNSVLYRVFPGARPLSGHNCVMDVPNIYLNDIHENIRVLGDKVMGYIGACGTVGPLDLKLYENLAKIGCKNVMDFFDLYGNQDVNKIVREEMAKII